MSAAPYSVSTIRALEERFRAAGLFRPPRVRRYEAGQVLEYDVRGVWPDRPARVGLEVERHVGGGFAGQVYRVRVLSIAAPEGPVEGLDAGLAYALKILVPVSGNDALDWIRAHLDEFLSLTLQRFANLWGGPLRRPQAAVGVMLLTLLAACGLWLNLRTLTTPERAALIIPLATYPLIYYLVAYMPRYRAPIDWILFILVGPLVWRAISGFLAGHTVESPNEPIQPSNTGLQLTLPRQAPQRA